MTVKEIIRPMTDFLAKENIGRLAELKLELGTAIRSVVRCRVEEEGENKPNEALAQTLLDILMDNKNGASDIAVAKYIKSCASSPRPQAGLPDVEGA